MIPEKQLKVINQIRKIYKDAGCNLMYKVDDWPNLNPYFGSIDGTWQIKTYWDNVNELKTPEGSHPVLGSYSYTGDISSAFEKIKEDFGLIHISSPKGLRGEKWDLWEITNLPE
jgi:hypothetical protein